MALENIAAQNVISVWSKILAKGSIIALLAKEW